MKESFWITLLSLAISSGYADISLFNGYPNGRPESSIQKPNAYLPPPVQELPIEEDSMSIPMPARDYLPPYISSPSVSGISDSHHSNGDIHQQNQFSSSNNLGGSGQLQVQRGHAYSISPGHYNLPSMSFKGPDYLPPHNTPSVPSTIYGQPSSHENSPQPPRNLNIQPSIETNKGTIVSNIRSSKQLPTSAYLPPIQNQPTSPSLHQEHNSNLLVSTQGYSHTSVGQHHGNHAPSFVQPLQNQVNYEQSQPLQQQTPQSYKAPEYLPPHSEKGQPQQIHPQSVPQTYVSPGVNQGRNHYHDFVQPQARNPTSEYLPPVNQPKQHHHHHESVPQQPRIPTSEYHPSVNQPEQNHHHHHHESVPQQPQQPEQHHHHHETIPQQPRAPTSEYLPPVNQHTLHHHESVRIPEVPAYQAPGYLPPNDQHENHHEHHHEQANDQHHEHQSIPQPQSEYLPPVNQPVQSHHQHHHHQQQQPRSNEQSYYNAPGYLPPYNQPQQNHHHQAVQRPDSHLISESPKSHQHQELLSNAESSYLPPHNTVQHQQHNPAPHQQHNSVQHHEHHNTQPQVVSPPKYDNAYLPPTSNVEQNHHQHHHQTGNSHQQEYSNNLNSNNVISQPIAPVINDIEDNSNGYDYGKKSGPVFEDGHHHHQHLPEPNVHTSIPTQESHHTHTQHELKQTETHAELQNHGQLQSQPHPGKIHTIQIINDKQNSVKTLNVLESSDNAGIKTVKILGPASSTNLNNQNVKTVKILSGHEHHQNVQTVKIFGGNNQQQNSNNPIQTNQHEHHEHHELHQQNTETIQSPLNQYLPPSNDSKKYRVVRIIRSPNLKVRNVFHYSRQPKYYRHYY